MTNEHQKTAKKPGEQTTAPDPQIELTDEQLERVTGGFEPNSPAVHRDTIIIEE